MALRRVQKELAGLQQTPNPESKLHFEIKLVDEENLLHWHVILKGPEGTPYEGGNFKIDITFSQDYPFKPPKVKFITKIYHPNIDDDGSICVDVLKPDNWKPATKVFNILVALAELLEKPNPDDALVASIAEVYIANKAKFDKTVKEYVAKYATGKCPE